MDQAAFEAALLLRVCKVGSLTAHPLGIVQLRPEENQLVIRLTNEPYIIRYWAEFILPYQHDDTSGDPRDLISGVYGLRYRLTGAGVVLYRRGSKAQIVLTGFNRRWWDRVAARFKADYRALFTHPDWTDLERDAHSLTRASRYEPPELLSPLLRRIRATTGRSPYNNTDIWHSSTDTFRMETTHGPHCNQLVGALCQGPTSLDWQVEWQRCACGADNWDSGCTIDFLAPGGLAVHYSNLRWDPDATAARHTRLAELNAWAFGD
ncbi:hypothetical protein [Streptomyces lunaelactis]|uniref:hypothetical protein n=1 Tax=Streptomyces lunaelactis TaxID=1535768 RepID=UPI001585C28F|nr:hypothetical protein [Streptomyces lunaelactis]NUK21948.1 hypothetical protein [Streptomyces lunaelactis]